MVIGFHSFSTNYTHCEILLQILYAMLNNRYLGEQYSKTSQPLLYKV